MFVSAATFIGCTALVGVITYFKTRHDDHASSEGYFLGGRSLGAVVIAGSLLLTNLSTEQIVGLSGQAYSDSLAVMAWETIAAVAMVVMALVFLPRYLKSGITTVPAFLEERYDKTTRIITSALFLAGFGIVFLPIVLYSGALALNGLFDVPGALGIESFPALCISIAGIGCIGCIYAIFGGLRAVAVSDTLNGIGLLAGGLLIPVLGVYALGQAASGSVIENFFDGLAHLGRNHPEKLSSIGAADSKVPFSTLFTGMFLVNCFYWCTNQGIVQRTLGARNLAAGQKGILIAAFFKLFGPVILVLPGIIAFHKFGGGLEMPDMAYPELVNAILPAWLAGFFGAVLFGAILSTYNSFLNSASTLFSLDIYKELLRPAAGEAETVRAGKYFGMAAAAFSICAAPLIAFAPGGLFGWMKAMNGFYNVPVLTIIVVGMFSKRIPPLAAKAALVLGVSLYALAKYVVNVDMHFLNVLGAIFLLNLVVMNVIGKLWPMKEPYHQKHSGDVDITEWKRAKPVGFMVIAATLAIYAFFAQFAPEATVVEAKVVLRNVVITLALGGIPIFLWVKAHRKSAE